MTADERHVLVPAGPGVDSTPQFIDHLEDIGRFRIRHDGHDFAVLDYQAGPGYWNLVHTWADPAVRGTGVASELVRGVMDRARAAGVQIIPSCPYLPVWLRRHPEYADLVHDSW